MIIQTIVNLLSTEEQAIGLTQPSGIGQRPKPLPIDGMNNSCGPVNGMFLCFGVKNFQFLLDARSIIKKIFTLML